jgi:hypothetical protein
MWVSLLHEQLSSGHVVCQHLLQGTLWGDLQSPQQPWGVQYLHNTAGHSSKAALRDWKRDLG